MPDVRLGAKLVDSCFETHSQHLVEHAAHDVVEAGHAIDVFFRQRMALQVFGVVLAERKFILPRPLPPLFGHLQAQHAASVTGEHVLQELDVCRS